MNVYYLCFLLILPRTEPAVPKGKLNCKAAASCFGLPAPLPKGPFPPHQPHLLTPDSSQTTAASSHIRHSLTSVGCINDPSALSARRILSRQVASQIHLESS